MKQGRNLNEVIVELQRQEGAKKDYIVPAQKMLMTPDAGFFEIHGNQAVDQFGMSDLFHRQVAQALNIPKPYYDLMQKEKPELLADNVNSWLKTNEKQYMVRSLAHDNGRTARAFLSARYRRIDNLQIAANVLPLFAGNPDYEVMSCEVTDNRLYLKIVNHRLEMEVVPGDIVQAGVMISNSEVGLGAVSVQPLVYRLVCTNGMVINDMGERRHHIGRRKQAALEDSFELYSDETLIAEDKAFMLKLRDVTRAAIEESRFRQVVGKLQEATQVPITGKVQDVVECTSKMFTINQDDSSNILNYLIQGGDLSKYGLANAITKSSQLVEDYDQATRLESVGYDVIAMTKEEWKQVNA